jgi:GNAT superfamily N-acetyltransferase
MIRALEGAQIEDRDQYVVVRTPKNPGYWWGNFLLLAKPPQPGDVKTWLSVFAGEFPLARHVALAVDVTEVSAVDVDEMTGHGLQLQHNAVLTAQGVIEPPHPNATAVIRQLTGDGDWRQAAELRAAVNEGSVGSDPAFLQARVAAERELTESGYGAWFGAFLDGTLVAQLGLVTDGAGIARYQNVETHPAARRQGLAGTLAWQAGQYGLGELGAGTLVIVADPHDIAIRIYRSVGFADAEAQVGFERQPDGSS